MISVPGSIGGCVHSSTGGAGGLNGHWKACMPRGQPNGHLSFLNRCCPSRISSTRLCFLRRHHTNNPTTNAATAPTTAIATFAAVLSPPLPSLLAPGLLSAVGVAVYDPSSASGSQ